MWNNITQHVDAQENVTKLVFTKDDAVAEAVLYRYPTYDVRTVICCSTMSGCPMGCRFCGAGDYFVRNLTAEEIVSQVDECIKLSATDPSDMKRLQIMFMSMGEPLLNMKQLTPALEILEKKYPKAALLISTSAPDVDYESVNDVSVRIPTIGLQFSVHESTDQARDKLIPFKHKLSLQSIAQAGDKWNAATGRKPFFNYCAHNDNTSVEDAERLLALFDPTVWNATVSVICERNTGFPASSDHQRKLAIDFGNLLLERGFDVRVFDPAGQDTIGGGCGQLWFVQDWMYNNPSKSKQSCGNGQAVVHVSRPMARV